MARPMKNAASRNTIGGASAPYVSTTGPG
jgi:hypothetical protein